jgi:hypothetical protein
LRLVDVVTKVAAMDGREMRALAAVCGAKIDDVPFGSSRAPAFAAHLLDVIARQPERSAPAHSVCTRQAL